MAQEVGKRLGKRQVLLREVQSKEVGELVSTDFSGLALD
jgi:hypothetical protein